MPKSSSEIRDFRTIKKANRHTFHPNDQIKTTLNSHHAFLRQLKLNLAKPLTV